jgi:DNA ligase D-like protein (predicted 3'-phosphoesterase)
MVVSRTAARLAVEGQGSARRSDVRSRAQSLELSGWVRRDDETGSLQVHAEGSAGALEQLVTWLRGVDGVRRVEVSPARVEGHEQFAIRGVAAGVFVVQEHQATAHHFDLRLEVDGVMRSWAVPKGPSLDPGVKRLAVAVEDHDVSHNDFEGATPGGGVIVWDRGPYEQGGRVPWPTALDRGHAVFVLHGAKLRGGFALQRTRGGEKPQWLLIKRRDADARPGSDILLERPESVITERTLREVLDGEVE